MNLPVRYYTRFLPSLERGGGSRRMLQVCEALEGGQLTLLSEPRGDGLGRSVPEVEHPFLQLWAESRRDAARRLFRAATRWAEEQKTLPACRMALMDDPLYFPPLVDALETAGVPIVAICHNLESLVPSQAGGRDNLDLMSREISLLRRCRGVITISREETVLLTNLGVPARYFPYQPPGPVRRRLLHLRARRRRHRKKGYLLLGSGYNRETLAGMRQVIDWWAGHNLAAVAGPLHVAGFRTERYFPPGSRDGVTVHGTLDDPALDRLLMRVRACICHQESGGGALTRIVDMSLAGVPVLASTHAARTYYGYPGVEEYAGLSGLEDRLRHPRRSAAAGFPPAADAGGMDRYLLERLQDTDE